jgi:hypothetical protein
MMLKKNSTNGHTHSSWILKKVTPNSLGFEWRKFEPDCILTVAHFGQLKYFIKSTGDQALTAMHFALENWSKFTLKVSQVVDLKYYPQYPDITFMSQHGAILLLCMTEKNEPAPIAKNPAKYHSTVFPVTAPEPKATLEQFNEAMKQLAAVYEAQKKVI